MQGEIRSRRTRAQQVHDRRFALAVGILVVVVVTTAAASYSSRANASAEPLSASPVASGQDTVITTRPDPATSLTSATYVAELRNDSAGSESPRALLRLSYDAGTSTVSYSLEIDSPLANPSVAAICQGSPGQSGSTLVTVFAGPTISGKFSGILAQGEITPGDLVGPLQGQDLADLILLVKEGGTYATVGTAGIPIDAIRGQIL